MRFSFGLLGEATNAEYCSNPFGYFSPCTWGSFFTYVLIGSLGQPYAAEFSLCASFSLALGSENFSCLGFHGLSAPSPLPTLKPGNFLQAVG